MNDTMIQIKNSELTDTSKLINSQDSKKSSKYLYTIKYIVIMILLLILIPAIYMTVYYIILYLFLLFEYIIKLLSER